MGGSRDMASWPSLRASIRLDRSPATYVVRPAFSRSSPVWIRTMPPASTPRSGNTRPHANAACADFASASPTSTSPKGSIPRSLPDVRAAIEGLEREGCVIKPIKLPHTQYAVATYYVLATAEASANLARFDGVRFGLRVEPPRSDLGTMYGKTRGSGFGAEVKRRIMLGTYVLSAGYYDAYYLKAQRVRTLIRRDFERAFQEVDIIASPTSPVPPFRLGERMGDPLAMYLADIYTLPASLAGCLPSRCPARRPRRRRIGRRCRWGCSSRLLPSRRSDCLRSRPRPRPCHPLDRSRCPARRRRSANGSFVQLLLRRGDRSPEIVLGLPLASYPTDDPGPVSHESGRHGGDAETPGKYVGAIVDDRKGEPVALDNPVCETDILVLVDAQKHHIGIVPVETLGRGKGLLARLAVVGKKLDEHWLACESIRVECSAVQGLPVPNLGHRVGEQGVLRARRVGRARSAAARGNCEELNGHEGSGDSCHRTSVSRSPRQKKRVTRPRRASVGCL